jgi:peptidoglycan hydrolase-like protein with peptidoglycan-binding domain
MPLESTLFKGDPRLNDCLIRPLAHITKGPPPAKGEHVGKIQAALAQLDNAVIDPDELESTTYGDSTAAAVKEYKRKRSIINTAYQHAVDDIVGQMTIDRMDKELSGHTTTHQEIIDKAFARSRSELVVVSHLLQKLATDIDAIVAMSEPDKSRALTRLLTTRRRDILVISRRLVLTTADPLSREFRDALTKLRDLVRRNISETATIVDQGDTGRCTASNFRPPGVPNAATNRTAAEPRVSVCTPFFTDSSDLQRDVLTHEWFHLLGLGDNPVANTAQAFTNANTIAQIVAFMHDRFRQANSDGGEPSVPPLPVP